MAVVLKPSGPKFYVVEHDAGIVDEDVELAELFLKKVGRPLVIFRRRNLELERPHIGHAVREQFLDGFFTLRQIAAGKDDSDSQLPEAASGLQTQTFVRSGDSRLRLSLS